MSDNWIPADSHQPREGIHVLGSCRVGHSCRAEVLIVEHFNAGYWRVVATGDYVTVISWQPLPQHQDAAKADKKHCRGCRNDFYNDKNPVGVKECWSFSTAKVVTRYRLSVNCPMDRRSGYEKMETHNCRQDDGFIFVEKIPEYAK